MSATRSASVDSLGRLKVLDRLVEDRLQVRELVEEHEGDLDVRGLIAVDAAPGFLDRLDVLALFHLAGQVLLIGGGKQEDLADFPQVHADRVVDAFLVLQRSRGGLGGLSLFFRIFGLLDVRFGPDIRGAAVAVFDHVGDFPEGFVGDAYITCHQHVSGFVGRCRWNLWSNHVLHAAVVKPRAAPVTESLRGLPGRVYS